MTQPTREERAAAEEEREVGVLDVVEYVHRDPIFGEESRQLAVVVAVDGQAVDLVPLAHYGVRVSPGDVTRLTGVVDD